MLRASNPLLEQMAFSQLTSSELRHALVLAAVIGTRMLGLFLVLPVFMLLSREIPGYTPALAGLALGVYGLSQAVLQQPFGLLSDRIGRRRVILLGLALFVAGSILAALAKTMIVLVLARALQGCGAVAGVTLAFAADHTRAEQRSTVMALIGMSIGASFLVSIMSSVPLASLFGLQGLFWLTAGLGVMGMLLLMKTPGGKVDLRTQPVAEFVQDSDLKSGIWSLCVSVFLLHALMTLLFVVLPGLLLERHALELAEHWKVYVPTMLVSAAIVFPLLRKISAGQKERQMLPIAFVALSVPFFLFFRELGLPLLMSLTVLYFLAFNLLEAIMPSMVSRMGGAGGRGKKMGLYTSFQFLGAFAGGICGGWMLQSFGPEQTLQFAAVLGLAWAVIAQLGLKLPKAKR